ncbi:MAG: DUF262 domain-containing protein [Bacteroidia bacterium]
MQTESKSVYDILSINATFFIPPFQRPYVWEKEQIDRFFSDVVRIIQSEHNKAEIDKQEHFLGTIVLRQESRGFDIRYHIIDGQQRLTTALLLLIALRDETDDPNARDYINDVLLKHPKSPFEHKIKLKQVTMDWEAYKALVEGQHLPPGKLTESYRLFQKFTRQHPDWHVDDYLTALRRMNLAIIFLDERPHKGEDPQIIFETLNSLGKPLMLSDLIRNYVLLRLRSEDQTRHYEQTWYPQVEESLGEKASFFFRDYLQYKTATYLKAVNDENTKVLYADFKKYFDKESDPEALLRDLTKYVPLYLAILEPDKIELLGLSPNPKADKEIRELLRNIFHDIGAEAFKPLVLGLLDYYKYKPHGLSLTEEELIQNLQIIRTYLIRRRVLRLTQGENMGIVPLVKRLKDIAAQNTNLWHILTHLPYAIRLPNDNEVREALAKLNFYEELKSYAKFILGKIEEHNSKVSIDFRSNKITVEHIMPRQLNEEWRNELGPEWKRIHETYLHNIGNLILTEFNSEMGNASFKLKKERLRESNLGYRHEILTLPKWDENAILAHQDKMIRDFLETFPLPEAYKTRPNYINYKETRYIFSPCDDDAPILAKGNRPHEILLGGSAIPANDWRDVFVAVLRHVKTHFPDQFSYLVQYQEEVFGRKDVILSREKMEAIRHEDANRAKYYRPLSNSLFVHVLMSAYECMRRTCKIMTELGIENQDVQIKLK